MAKASVVDWRPVSDGRIDRMMLLGAFVSPAFAFAHWAFLESVGLSRLLSSLFFMSSALALLPFSLVVMVWVHELGHAAGMRWRGLPILGFYSPGFGWCGEAPTGSRARPVWVGLIATGGVRTGVREDTPESRRSVAISLLAGPLASVIGGLAIGGLGVLLWPVFTHPIVRPVGIIIPVTGLLSVLIGLANLWPARYGGIISSGGYSARQLMGGDAADLMLLLKAALAESEMRLEELTEELDAAAAKAKDPMTRLILATKASASARTPERQQACWDALSAIPNAKAKALLTASLAFAFPQEGQPVPSPQALGLPKRPDAAQLLHVAPLMLLHAHVEDSTDIRTELETLGRWSRMAAPVLGWTWLLANERVWRTIDPALGGAFREGAKIPEGETLK